MKRTKNLGKRIIYPLLFVLLSCIVIYNVIRITSPGDGYRVVPYKLGSGWGYRIVLKDKVIVEQPFIPRLSGKKEFPSRKSASETGELMLERLKNHQQPVFSVDDLEKVGLDSLGNLNR
jgi:hypothetical protein